MADKTAFAATFTALRGVLERHRGSMTVYADTPDAYQLCSASLKNRIGRPLFVAAVEVKKNYVSFHLMPIYASPDLVKALSPALRKRMQGKSCFNFTTIAPAQLKELAALTKTGIARFRNIKLPWA